MKQANISSKHQTNIDTIRRFAGESHEILRRAFNRKSAKIAANFSALGKSMRPRTVRKMWERPADVIRRNILENACLLLGVCFMESPRTFEFVWQFLESYVAVLRGGVRPRRSLDEAFSEYRFASASMERAFFSGELKENPQPLIFVDQSLRALFAHLHVIDFAET